MNPRTWLYVRRLWGATAGCFIVSAALTYVSSGDVQFIMAVLFVAMFTCLAVSLFLLNPQVVGLQPVGESEADVAEQALIDDLDVAMHFEDTKMLHS